MFEIPTGPFTEAEVRAAKEQGIVPGWLRRILESYAKQLEIQKFLSEPPALAERAEDDHLEEAYELLVDCE